MVAERLLRCLRLYLAELLLSAGERSLWTQKIGRKNGQLRDMNCDYPTVRV